MDAVEEIKTRLDVVDLISEYLPLKPAGTNAWKANCPFHSERTPSFYVSRTRQSWHCFGCDQGGDLISFVEKIEGMEFREALELLAQKSGVVLPSFSPEKASQKKRLHEINDLATRFFRSILNSFPQAEIARQYLMKRGVDDLTADLFKLGYAPESWSALSDALQKKGVTAAELVLAGLCAKREKGEGVYDRFRNRIMFPIADVHGNIVGFTGRILSEDKKEAKYVNTPETQIYKKSAVLYGLDKAKGPIRQENLAVIVEGNMDVVGSHQFNVENVVASSGTALTSDQLSLLKRFTTNLAIAFDQDAAGNAATLRGLDLARQQDFSIKIISLPPDAGKDPDEAVRKDPQIWRDAIKHAIGIMEWVYRNAFKNRHAEQPEDKKLIARDVLIEIKRIADPVERDHWMKRLAKDLAVGEEALKEAMGKSAELAQQAKRPAASTPSPSRNDTQMHENDQEKRLLAMIVSAPDLFFQADRLGLKPEDFGMENFSALYTKLKAFYHATNSDLTAPASTGSPNRLPADLAPEEAKQMNALAFLAEREFQGLSLDELKRELKTGVDTLQGLNKARERKRLEQDMREAERVGDQSRIADLTKRFSDLQG